MARVGQGLTCCSELCLTMLPAAPAPLCPSLPSWPAHAVLPAESLMPCILFLAAPGSPCLGAAHCDPLHQPQQASPASNGSRHLFIVSPVKQRCVRLHVHLKGTQVLLDQHPIGPCEGKGWATLVCCFPWP